MTRHEHGTALAEAGVPVKDIASSLDHASRKTTERYLHAKRKSAKLAIDAMPDVTYPSKKFATGAAGPVVATDLRKHETHNGVQRSSQW